jgi:uncharacterized membrane protein YiaA
MMGDIIGQAVGILITAIVGGVVLYVGLRHADSRLSRRGALVRVLIAEAIAAIITAYALAG